MVPEVAKDTDDDEEGDEEDDNDVVIVEGTVYFIIVCCNDFCKIVNNWIEYEKLYCDEHNNNLYNDICNDCDIEVVILFEKSINGKRNRVLFVIYFGIIGTIRNDVGNFDIYSNNILDIGKFCISL